MEELIAARLNRKMVRSNKYVNKETYEENRHHEHSYNCSPLNTRKKKRSLGEIDYVLDEKK